MELIDNDGKKTYVDETETSYNSIEEYRTRPFKQQTEPRRNKRQLDPTTPSPKDGNKKKNKQDDDNNSTFSESHSVSELRDFFENQYEDPPTVNIEQNLYDLDKDNPNEKTEENNEHKESEKHPSADIYLTQTPENASYITDDEIRTQNIIIPDEQQSQNMDDQQIRS